MKETDTLYLFYRHQFGQWTQRDITDIDGTTYNCCEQYMMAQKARLFGDEAARQAIMAEASPAEQQALGRHIKPFDDALWHQHRFAIVWQGNFLKFSQHPDLRQRLLDTGDRILAEASPTDLIWGIGFSADDSNALQPEHWRGKNLLGEVLMQVRNALRLEARA